MQARRLLNMRRRCIDWDGKPALHGRDGDKSPLGTYIPDAAYSPSMEPDRVPSHFCPAGFDWTIVHQVELIHRATKPPLWPKALRHLARRFRLSSLIVDDMELRFAANLAVGSGSTAILAGG